MIQQSRNSALMISRMLKSSNLLKRASVLLIILCTTCAYSTDGYALDCNEVGYDFEEDNCCFNFYKDLLSSDVARIRVIVVSPSTITVWSGSNGWTPNLSGNILTFTPPSGLAGTGSEEIGKFCINPNGASPVVFHVEFQDSATGQSQCTQYQEWDC